MYRPLPFDDIEDVEKYRPGGYHPVDLNDILDNKYRIVHKLGYGGFATIWLALDLFSEQYVALKILISEASNKELAFFNYLEKMGHYHRNIVRLLRSFIIKGPNGTHQCLVLDAVGPSLREVAKNHRRPFETRIHDIVQETIQGLLHMHHIGLCHGGKASLNIYNTSYL